MKLKTTVFAFLVSTIFLILSCNENENQLKTNQVQYSAEVLPQNKPKKTHVDFSALDTHTPGENGLLPPASVSGKAPQIIEINFFTEIKPGLSALPQTIDQKLSGEPPVISKKAEKFQVIKSKVKHTKPSEPAVVTVLPKAIQVSIDSLPYVKPIALKSGLIEFQHGDSIFPPILLYASQPKQIDALPFNYKEDALLDICSVDANQELPNSFIREIVQDNQGVMWFATHTGGMISYNGAAYSQYTINNGLSSDMTLALAMDKNNNLWIGTQGGGANYFDGKKITQYSTKQGLASNNVTDIMEDSKGNIWFATTKGVSVFNGSTITTYTPRQGIPTEYIISLLEDNQGNIWIGTYGGGATMFDGTEFVTFNSDNGLASDYILSMAKDSLGNIWFGTNGGGVSKFDGSTFTNYASDQGLGSDIILSVLAGRDNNMWFGTFGNGVTKFDGTAFTHFSTHDGLNDGYVRDLFEDNTGNLWIGTDGGISRLNIKGFVHITKDQGLSDNLVLLIKQDHKNRLWMSPYDGGIIILSNPFEIKDPKKITQITTEQGLPNNIVTSMAEDNKGNFWIGTYGGGISKMNGQGINSGEITCTNYSTEQGLANDIVRAVISDKKGNTWFATEGGAARFDGSKFITLTKKEGLGNSKVLSAFQDQMGALWFGTMDGGVSRLYQDTIATYTTQEGLSNNTVWCIAQDNNGIMWFGTDGGGISCFNGHSFKTINSNDGLCNNYVFSLSCDQNNAIWAGTQRGLTQIRLPENPTPPRELYTSAQLIMINYTKMDGLKGLDFYTNAVFHDNENRLWWGTDKSLSILDLEVIKQNENAPIAQFNGITINDRTFDFGKLKANMTEYEKTGIHFSKVTPYSNMPQKLSLPYYQNHLAFRFSATDWSASHQIQYQYKLVGVENEWGLITKNHVADYRNIDPGRYQFMFRAIGKSGIWSEPIEYSFVIRWPWYATWWAALLYFLIFGAIVWLIVKWRVSIIQKQKTALEGMVRHRTKELKNAVKLAEQATIAKSQFIATISHEIRTPLNAVIGLTHLTLNTDLTPKQADYLQNIDRSASTLLGLINNILDFSKIEAGKMQLEKTNFDLEILLNSTIILNIQNSNEKNLEFVVSIASNVPRYLIGDPLRIGQVFTNLCNNAIKFTSDGEIDIFIEMGEKISDSECYLQITVKDTGIGIEKEQIPFLFDEFKQADNTITRKFGGTGLGLSISKLLTNLMEGKIWLESEPGIGSSFYFTFKVGLQNESATLPCIIPEELLHLDMLVCDDNPTALKTITNTLKSFGFKVDAVASGEDVLKQLSCKNYDLLLIDMQLSGMNGLDTIMSIKADSQFSPIKTILITGSEEKKKSLEQTTQGIDGYLKKPYVPSTILDIILKVFGMDKPAFYIRHQQENHIKQFENTLGGSRILLAEDNEINQQVVSELLEKINVSVDLAGDGASAVKMIRRNHYDLILMDLHMPVMDGYMASSQIRKQNKEVPIIAITADAMSTITEKCSASGINGIITKPIDPEMLYIEVNKWVNLNKKNHSNIEPSKKNHGTIFPDISIQELDTRTGIRRFGNNEVLFLKMLKKFISTNRHTCESLQKLFNQQKFDQSHLMIHTLKGESGNVGADAIYRQSQRVEETILAKNESDFEKEINLLESSLAKLSRELKPHFEQMVENSIQDSQHLPKLITKLISHLQSKNPKALDLLDELAENGISAEKLQDINLAVDNENTKEAIFLLKKLSGESLP